MADLQAEHDGLSRRVGDLRAFEQEYRARLRTYLEEQKSAAENHAAVVQEYLDRMDSGAA